MTKYIEAEQDGGTKVDSETRAKMKRTKALEVCVSVCFCSRAQLRAQKSTHQTADSAMPGELGRKEAVTESKLSTIYTLLLRVNF